MRHRERGKGLLNFDQVREISALEVTRAVKKLCMSANCNLPQENLRALKRAIEIEESPLGKQVLRQILENHRIAREECLPACQDTGVAVVFLEIGQNVHIVDGSLYDAVNEGVRQGYTEGYLRKSMVDDPVYERRNTGDNTPAIIHVDVVPGDRLKITVAPKGGGAENMSRLAMLTPAAGIEGVKDFVVDTVRRAGPNPCPPIIVGVGIGGNFEAVALMAKKALLRPLGSHNLNPMFANLEKDLLMRVNKLGIGPQGFGGRVTALAVHVEFMPCHIASLPVAVNLNCHVSPHESMTI